MKITFHGAAQKVTGSKHLILTEDKKILLDCGMHQGFWKEAYELNKEFPFNPKEIDAVILSHAHIDHSGLLPKLVKEGFSGKIYTSIGTAQLLEPLLLDSASIQKEDFEYYSKLAIFDETIEVLEPLYEESHVRKMLKLIITKKREDTFEIFEDIKVTFFNAGHILGSCQILLESENKKLGFTGDLGSRNRKIINDPVPIPNADFFITEATYGNKLHERKHLTREDLAKVINDTYSRRGRVIIPSFALERTQEILYDLHRLYNQKKVPRIPVFVDSPLATDFTKIFSNHLHEFDKETHDFFVDKGQNPFTFRNVTHTKSVYESKKLNKYQKPCIVIAGSGMCEAGRVKHHLRHGLANKRNTVLIVGYQAEYTLGRKLVDGKKQVEIFGDTVSVKASIESISGYSAHGDRNDLIANIESTKGVKNIAIVHADLPQAIGLKKSLEQKHKDLNIFIPKPGDTIEI